MNRLPDAELVLVPGGTLITATPEAGRALALSIARPTIHNIQPDLDVLKEGRAKARLAHEMLAGRPHKPGKIVLAVAG